MTKMWRTKGEWVAYASCGGNGDIFTSESPSAEDRQEVKKICNTCRVRPECIRTALDEDWSSVVVAGVYLPDPAYKRSLRRIYNHFRDILPKEYEARGEDI